MSKLEIALNACITARKAHEAQHGSPDQYNGVSAHPVTGVLQREHAYTENWYATYADWTNKFDDLMRRY